ncbi:MAG: hypothetical protein K6E40_15840, partial [Desulfovibrio sp.]|nr:hypothetical protein [Desulfovibrio sp.]
LGRHLRENSHVKESTRKSFNISWLETIASLSQHDRSAPRIKVESLGCKQTAVIGIGCTGGIF